MKDQIFGGSIEAGKIYSMITRVKNLLSIKALVIVPARNKNHARYLHEMFTRYGLRSNIKVDLGKGRIIQSPYRTRRSFYLEVAK